MSRAPTEALAPVRLESGALVGVCAPAGPVDPARLDAGLAILETRFRVRIDRDAVLARDGYFAGDDAHRVAQLNALLGDDEVSAIFMARGGYGLTRILSELDAESLRRRPIPIVGFSDGTALLAWAERCAGVRAIHGPVIGQLAELGEADHECLFELLSNPNAPGVIAENLERMGEPASEERRGRLLGGNLSLLSSLVGTGYLPEHEDAILLIEDVGERPYAVDRMLTHLANAGVFDRIKGVLVGDFERCEENKQGGPDVYSVIDERLRSFGVPGLRMPGVGHGAVNRALPLGVLCCLHGASFAIEEAAVR